MPRREGTSSAACRRLSVSRLESPCWSSVCCRRTEESDDDPLRPTAIRCHRRQLRGLCCIGTSEGNAVTFSFYICIHKGGKRNRSTTKMRACRPVLRMPAEKKWVMRMRKCNMQTWYLPSKDTAVCLIGDLHC
jgi:hypothetical protein